MRAAIYARVSSAAQREAQTIEAQLRALPEYVARQGWQLVATYVDDGRSAASGGLALRTGLAAAHVAAERREIDVLVVWDMDRLTRAEDMLERAQVLGPFQRAGVKVATVNGGILDLDSSFGDLYASIQAVAAADWLRKHRERIKAGRARAIAAGGKPAGATPFGLAWSKQAGWSIDEPAAEVVREIFRRVAGGESCEQVGADLEERGVRRPRGGAWPRERVYELVRSRTYRGEWVIDKALGRVIAVPPIVTLDEWHAAEAALTKHAKRGLRRTRHVYLLEDFATCELCGASVRVVSSTRDRPGHVGAPSRYACSHRYKAPRGATRCVLPYLRSADIDQRLWARLCEWLTQPLLIERALAERAKQAGADARDWGGDVASFERRLEQLTRAEGVALARFRRGLLSEAALDVELGAIARERAMVGRSLEAARKAAASSGGARDQVQALLERVDELRTRLPALPHGEARRHAVRAVLASPARLSERRIEIPIRLSAGLASGTVYRAVSPGQRHDALEFLLVA